MTHTYYLSVAFLSGDMTYSCAIFPELDADLKGPLLASPGPDCTSSCLSTPAVSGSSQSSSEYSIASGIKVSPESTRISEAPTTYARDKQDDSELCEAQIRKMLHIVRRADIRPGHRVRHARQIRAWVDELKLGCVGPRNRVWLGVHGDLYGAGVPGRDR